MSFHDCHIPAQPRYDSLTIWRGIACLLVIIYHSARSPLEEVTGFMATVFAILGKCWMGVPLFFVISGYCVTASADALRQRQSAGKTFFWRRFRRIYPPYWAALAVTSFCSCLVGAFFPEDYFQALGISSPRALTKWQWMGNLSLTETWRWHLTGGAENALLPPSWTLCYEEQFYFLAGLVLVVARRYFFCALSLLTLAVSILVLFPSPGLRTEGLFLDGQWLMFAAGVMVYYALCHASPRRKPWFCLPLLFGILWAAPEIRQLQLPTNQAYLAAFSFALLILGLKQWDASIHRCGMFTPLRRLGEMCYSLYLVHWPVVRIVGHALDALGANSPTGILLVRIPCCVATTILIGSIFHRLIERRFWNPRFNESHSRASEG